MLNTEDANDAMKTPSEHRKPNLVLVLVVEHGIPQFLFQQLASSERGDDARDLARVKHELLRKLGCVFYGDDAIPRLKESNWNAAGTNEGAAGTVLQQIDSRGCLVQVKAALGFLQHLS